MARKNQEALRTRLEEEIKQLQNQLRLAKDEVRRAQQQGPKYVLLPRGGSSGVFMLLVC